MTIGLKSDIGDLWPFEIFSTRVYAVAIEFLSFWTKGLQFESFTVALEDSQGV